MNSKNIIIEYEKLLKKEQGVNISASYFCYTKDNNHKLALNLFRYVIEDILKWTPCDVDKKLDIKIIKDLHLLLPYKYLIFPEELNKRKDCNYVAHLLYPEVVPYNIRTVVLNSYKKILDEENGKLSKNFFLGTEGELRACICLQFILQEYLLFSSIEEIYYFFSTPNAMRSLRQYRLSGICNDLFESPLEFVHCALPAAQKNELYYHFYKFEAALREKKLKTKVKRILGE